MKIFKNLFRLKFFFSIVFVLNAVQLVTAQCNPQDSDSDNDGTCDAADVCPNFDDDIDIDDDGIPYCLDNCVDVNENCVCDDTEANLIVDKFKIHFTRKRGYMTAPFQLELICNNPNATIYYSTNWGAEWLFNEFINVAQIYTSPIQINGSTQVRAIAIDGIDTTETKSHTYIDISTYPANQQEILKQYPVFETSSASFGSRDDDAKTIVEFFWPSGEQSGTSAPAGIRNRQRGVGQRGDFRLYFRGEYGHSRLDYELFPRDENTGSQSGKKYDKVNFHGGSNDGFNDFDLNYRGCNPGAGTLMKDRFFQSLQLDVNNDGIRGQYYLMFKQGVFVGVKNAGDVPHEGFMDNLFGGSKDDYGLWTYYSRDLLPANAYNTSTNKTSFYNMMDVTNYIDYILVQWFSGNRDWGAINVNNNVVVGGKINGPYYHWIWDSQLTDPGCGTTYGNYVLNTYTPRFDIDFRMDFADRILLHCFNDGALTQNKLLQKWDTLANELQPAVSLVYNESIWTSAEQIYRNKISAASGTFLNWLINNGYYPNLNPVDYSINGGAVNSGTTLTLSNVGAGDIYYTTDGTDPRAFNQNGAISSTAQLYNGSFTLPDGTVQVLARVKNGSTWSAGQPVIFQVGDKPGLIINEIHFNPSEPNISDEDLEFIELANFGSTAVNLEYFRLQGGVRFKFDYNRSPIIQPNDFVVIASDATVFESFYGFAPGGEFVGKLSNSGEKIKLTDNRLNVLNEVEYEDVQALCAESGYSLSFDPNGTDNTKKSQWKASAILNGSPNVANVLSTNLPVDIVINEIHYNPGDSIYFNSNLGYNDTISGKNFEFVELKNIGTDTLDLAGISFSKGIEIGIKDELKIPPNGFVVFAENECLFEQKYGFAPDGRYSGKLANGGEKLTLKNCSGGIIDSLRYDDGGAWPGTADKGLYSIALQLGGLDNNNPANWSAQGVYVTPRAENSFCTPSLVQQNNPSISSQIYQVANFIQSNGIVNANAQVSFKAGDYIELTNDFEVKQEAEFDILIEGCE